MYGLWPCLVDRWDIDFQNMNLPTFSGKCKEIRMLPGPSFASFSQDRPSAGKSGRGMRNWGESASSAVCWTRKRGLRLEQTGAWIQISSRPFWSYMWDLTV